jgi:hypothetical protein
MPRTVDAGTEAEKPRRDIAPCNPHVSLRFDLEDGRDTFIRNVDYHMTKRRCIQDGNIYNYSCENVKSYRRTSIVSSRNSVTTSENIII